jgi:putative adhesin
MRGAIAGAVILLLGGAGLAAAQQANPFVWNGVLTAGQTLEIKGVNGSVRAEPASGAQAEVTAVKRGRRSDPASVSVQVVGNPGGGVTICAVYPSAGGQQNDCQSGDANRMTVHDNDVIVDFTVKVPAGVRLVGRTVNGGVTARSLQGDVDGHTVNGRVEISTTGIASAQTVNGAIDVSFGTAVWTEPLEFSTVNGSITVKVPPAIDAQVKAEMMNGSFSSDLPLAVQSSHNGGRRISGTIGNGGRELSLHTLNGSIHLEGAR